MLRVRLSFVRNGDETETLCRGVNFEVANVGFGSVERGSKALYGRCSVVEGVDEWTGFLWGTAVYVLTDAERFVPYGHLLLYCAMVVTKRAGI